MRPVLIDCILMRSALSALWFALSLALALSAEPALAQGSRPVPNLSVPPAPPPGQSGGQGSGASDELADPTTGCRIVRADNEPNVGITWSGECYHGLAHGTGVLQWYQE